MYDGKFATKTNEWGFQTRPKEKPMLNRKTKKMLRVVVPLILLCLIVWPINRELAPFDYNVHNWWEFYSRSNLSIGPGSYRNNFYRVKELKTYEKDLSLLVQEIYCFVDSQPDLSELLSTHSNTINFQIVDNGLQVNKWSSLDGDPEIIHFEVSAEGWESVRNYKKVFPKNFRSDFIKIYIEFPDCIVFRGDETSKRSLVYTRDGKRPDGLIAEYQSYSTCVRVEKLAHSWYDVCPFQFLSMSEHARIFLWAHIEHSFQNHNLS